MLDFVIDESKDIESGISTYTVTMIYSYLYFITKEEKETFESLEEAQNWIIEKQSGKKIKINKLNECKEDSIESNYDILTPHILTPIPSQPSTPRLKENSVKYSKNLYNPQTVKESLIDISIPTLKVMCGDVVKDNKTPNDWNNCNINLTVKKNKRKRKRNR